MNVNNDLIFDLFRIRSDIYGRQNVDKGEKVNKPFDFVALTTHLAGIERIGSYSTNPINDTIKWICVDFDIEFHSIDEVVKFIKICQDEFNLTAHLEKTKSGGSHVWFFLNSEVLAWKGRRVMQYILLSKMNLKASNANSPDAVEVFPKQESLAEDGFGNFVYLPFNGKSLAEGRTLFVDYDNGLTPYPDQMAYLKGAKRISEQDLNRIISKFNIDSTLQVYERKSTPFTEETSKSIKEKREKLLPCAKRVLEQGVDEGQRDCVTFALAKHLKRAGYTEEEVELELMEWNSKNRPPLAEYIVRDKIRQAEKYDGLDCENTMSSWCDKDNCPVKKENSNHAAQTTITSNIIPNEKVTFPVLKQGFKNYLYFNDYDVIDVVCATLIINRKEIDPVWVFLVDPPSSGKTEILRAFTDPKYILSVSTLTPKSLISGKVSPETYMTDKDPSLFAVINGKVFIVKDFTSVLELPPKEQAEIFSYMRDSYDGYCEKKLGIFQKIFSYKTRYGFLAGVTLSIDNAHALRNIMGERYLKYRIGNDRDKALIQARKNRSIIKQIRTELQYLGNRFLNSFSEADLIDIKWPEQYEQLVESAADVVTLVRTPVSRDWRYFDVINVAPEPEMPMRMAASLKNLADGLALIRGKQEITEDEVKTVMKVAFDSLPVKHLKILKVLYKLEDYTTHAEISQLAGFNTYTVTRVLEDYFSLGVVDMDKSVKNEYKSKLHPRVKTKIEPLLKYMGAW